MRSTEVQKEAQLEPVQMASQIGHPDLIPPRRDDRIRSTRICLSPHQTQIGVPRPSFAWAESANFNSPSVNSPQARVPHPRRAFVFVARVDPHSFQPVILNDRVPPRRDEEVEGPAFRALRRLIISLLALATCTAAWAQTAPAAPRFVVVLDAAHGGDDPGARLGSETEKAFNLAFSIRLRSLLAARGFAVVTTRDSDAGVDPDRRADIADHADSQACLSLHAATSGSGVHLFVSSLAPVQNARSDARFLPWKTAQAAWVMRSISLAGLVNSALSHANVPVTLGRTALPAIDSMTCPAVAIEIAPDRSSDAQGPASLDDADYQARVADALAAALVEWRSQSREDHQP
jgi:N-acetylmuramoyl-L-alanine amidase